MSRDHRFIHAGPGTGKSTEIIKYVGRCLEQGIGPNQILVVTLTNVAATDMREKLQNHRADGTVECTTLHSWSLATLERNGVLKGQGFGGRILSGDYETVCMLWDLSNSFGDIASKERMLKALSAGWARQQDEHPGWAVEEADVNFEEAVYGWLRTHKAILLDQIVPETLTFLRDNPTADELSRYKAVIVDEYQDLNSADQEVLRLLSRDLNFLVAGDDDQSIYSFRYAHPEGIRRYANAHQDAVAGGNNVSHRCPTSVIKAARRLLQRNRPLDSHTVQAASDATSGQLLACQFPSYEAEIKGVCSAIRSLLSQGVAPGDILVLTPWRELGYAIRDSLNQDVIPATAARAETFFVENVIRNRESAERFAILNLVARPEDRVAWRVALSGVKASNRRAPTYGQVLNAARESSVPPHHFLNSIMLTGEAPRGTRPAVQWFRQIKEELEGLGPLSGREFLDAWCRPDEESLRPLREFCERYFDELMDPREVFNKAEEGVRISDPPRTADFIRVMSLHKSKGLEAKAVIVAGAVKGLIPRRWDPRKTVLSEEAHLKEQRRLMYVALTRSSDTVLITTSRRWGAGRLGKAGAQPRAETGPQSHLTTSTSFLGEIGPELRHVDPSAVNALSLSTE